MFDRKSAAPTPAISVPAQNKPPPPSAEPAISAATEPMTNNGRPTSHRQLTADLPDGVRKVRLSPHRSRDIALDRSLVTQRAARSSEPHVYDGQAEIWWDSLGDVIAAVTTPAGQQAAIDLLEDERRFIDLERSPLWIGEEHTVIDSTSGDPNLGG